jgi:hypothetical protein
MSKRELCVLAHLESFLGRHTSRLLHSEGVDVYLWENVDGKETGLVCTHGMSDNVQPLTAGASCFSKEPRTEILAYCSVRDAEVLATLLLDLSAYPLRESQHLFWFHTLPLGRTIRTGSRLDGILFRFPPFPADKVTFYDERGRIDLLWALPVSMSEIAFCRQNGTDALEDALDRNNIDFADLCRDPLY